MNKMRQMAVASLITVLTVMSACSKGESDAEKNAADSIAAVEAAKARVTVETVKLQNVDQIEELTATVKAEAKNDIASQGAGRIVKIYTEVGQTVQKGQLLVKMDPTSLLQVKTQLANYEADYNRTLELCKAGGASQQAVDQLKVQLDVTRETYNNLLENVELKAPISGVITARNYDSGDMYKGGEAIVTINQITPVKIVVAVSEENFSSIKLGQKINIKLDTYPDKTFTGSVSLIYPVMDESTRTFQVEISIPNGDRKVRPGMFARAVMNYGTKKRVLVPDVAVQKQMGSGDHYVYIYKDGKVKYSIVKTGRRIEDQYEIISGVEDNDQVVISGISKLADGKEVEIVKK